ncbi:MAG: HAD-IIB family hydrolase [Planctomycetes bacterium]|nr:HAD-IIB family hydrolase [Planctomycetota bacterium]
MDPQDGLYIVMISVHGLVRGERLELGRDPDTGGQVKYVVELARALAAHPGVARVDLLTRRVQDPKVDAAYAAPEEALAPGARIVRLECGPRRYLRKEVLWPYLTSFADHAVQHIRRVGHVPDIVHTHYADAGHVGVRLCGVLGAPHFHTGHSLGRVKRERLLAQGLAPETIESRYNISRRIEAEEQTMDSAALVIASTRQEVEKQYQRYDNYGPDRMEVIPPGVDLSRFRPPARHTPRPAIQREVDRFLARPEKPMILALSRPDERKNIGTLLRAFGENAALRAQANLVLVVGNRDDLKAMDRGAQSVLQELLYLVDRYDLYGHVAYPKRHAADDVPELYRLAARRRGVFVNPALTEPFGLTLIEAASSGLPIVATNDGGPRDILANCRNGLLIDPLDATAVGAALLDALSDRRRWQAWARAGLRGARGHYAWASHVERYLKAARRIVGTRQRRRLWAERKSRLPSCDRAIVCDVDHTLTGDRRATQELFARLERFPGNIGFGVATGRNLQSVLAVLKQWKVPRPDVLITSVGSEIHYGPKLIKDAIWEQRISYRWNRDRVVRTLRGTPGLLLQEAETQRPHKVSYYIDPEKAPSIEALIQRLRKNDLHVNVIESSGQFLDVLPVRASKGLAVRDFVLKWGLPLDRVLVVGQSGNDRDMLTGNTLAVVVGNHSAELEGLRGHPLVHFAERPHAWGILEGLEHYGFLEATPRAAADEADAGAGEAALPEDAEGAAERAAAG